MADQVEEQWLTYRELGALLGCTATAARMHAHRRGWPRRAPNRVGAPARVLVPDVQGRASHDAAQFVARSNGAEQASLVALLTERVAEQAETIRDLRARLDGEVEERRRLIALLTDRRPWWRRWLR